MTNIKKVLKYTLGGLLGVVVLLIAGLLLYYTFHYKETPQPGPAVFKSPLHNSANAPDVAHRLLPYPKKAIWSEGVFKWSAPVTFSARPEAVDYVKKVLKNRLHAEGVVASNGKIKFTQRTDISPQAYHLNIQPNRIDIEYGDSSGLFYALTTVRQLAQYNDNLLPCVQIEDSPDLKTRGAMLDISRGKIPTLKTLFEIVDFLTDVKYNHLQLYVEGFSFGYPSFKNLWEKTETPLTPEEIRQLDAYCRDRQIELVANQNSLGHMAAWLATDEYKELAECPEGYKLFGLVDMKTTLAPTNPKSLELVKKMSADLLPNFSSNLFNVNLDEPFELGKSKAHPVKDPKDVAAIYIDYAKKLNEYVNSQGKKMMMWGDVVAKHPDMLPEIPKNITLLEWRYEAAQSFENISQVYQKAGLHYMVCPGTSSWSSMTGRTDNMMGNIENAVSNGIKYGADGMLITDWGDTPHLQYWTVSCAGLAYGAALSWNNADKDKIVLDDFLSRAVFKDKTNTMGRIVLDLGRYNQFEEYPMVAMTTTSLAYRFGIMDKMITDAIDQKMQGGMLEFLDDPTFKPYLQSIFSNPKIYNAPAILQLMDSLETALSKVQPGIKDSALVMDEYKNAINMVRLGANLKYYNNYHHQISDAENKRVLTTLDSLCTVIETEHKRLWLSRNKSGGLERSLEEIRNIQKQAREQLALLEKGGLNRRAKGVLGRITAAAAASLFLSGG